MPPAGPAPDVIVKDDLSGTVVDDYWGEHTLHQTAFLSAKESEQYLRKRNSEYPLFAELMDLYGDHRGETILDYGCGPGDDVTGFLLWSNAQKVIGIDVSAKALGLLRHRLALHHVDLERVELIRITASTGKAPLPDDSVDWIQCGGVLHHTTHPKAVVMELRRLMKPCATGGRLPYNGGGVPFHVRIAY